MTGFEIGILIATGFLAGIFGTLVGIGGGIFFVPIFLLLLHYSPQEAVGTSLVAVFVNVLSGTILYLRQKRVDIRCGWKFGVATIPGAFLGSWLAGLVGDTLVIIFGFTMIILAIFNLFRKLYDRSGKTITYTRTIIDAHKEVFRYSPKVGMGIVISFFVGVISSLFGIGGGVIHVPVLIGLLGFPVHIAAATSLFVLTISAFTGGISHIVLGNVLLLPAVIVAVAAIPGTQIGAAISQRVTSRVITRLLTLALVLVGVRLIMKGFGIF